MTFAIKLFLARFADLVEQAWPALWPGVPAVISFCALGLIGLWPAAPLWLHIPALLLLVGLTAYTVLRLWRRWTWPSREAGLARLERDNALAYQPLRKTVRDQAVHGRGPADALWQAHLNRMAAQSANVKSPRPRLSWVSLDRYAFTSAAFIALAIGLFMAGDQSGVRLAESFMPNMGGAPAQVDVEVRALAPSYTGIAPLLLTAFNADSPASDPITLPAGTTLEMRLKGGWRTPRAVLAGKETVFETAGKNTFSLTMMAVAADGLSIRQGGRVQYTWPGRFETDQPPQIAIQDLPERTMSDALFFNYEIWDDYGIERTAMFLRPKDDPASPQRFDIPTPKINPRDRETRRFTKDLTASRWAGRPVTVQLEAWDGLDQKGQSEPLEMLLPERAFEHPLSAEIIQQRKRLFFENGSRLGVAQWLGNVSRAPARFDESLWAFSMLRSAHYRLTRHDSQDVIDEVTQQLWEIATYLEDGGVSQERAAMRDAMEQMMSALEAADTEAFDALSRELEAKIADLMSKQMQQMKGQDMPEGMEGGDMRMVDSSTLERMMQQMRDLAAAGDMAGAMEMLEAIQSLMENLNSAPGPSQEMLEQAQAAQDALEDLNALMEDQRALMNQTVRQALEGAQQDGDNQGGEQNGGQQQGGEQPGGQGGEQADGQGGLASGYEGLQGQQSGLEGAGRALGQRLSDAGVPVPGGLENASGSMGQAAARLGQQRGLPALRAQADALRNLEAAQKALESQVEQMMQQIRQQSSGRDPFGRPDGRSLSDGQVKIPTEAEAKRAREIRDELQRRLGDPTRSLLERSYFKRLLEQFSR
ncbi:MAG: DUF4175 family protein [Pseudomonadota bacterium]